MAMRKRPRLRDIAERVGVSETAASFALNGKPGISDETRRRILDTVEELGWRPSYAARALSGARASTVGFILPLRSTAGEGAAGGGGNSELFFMRLMSGLQSVLGPSHVGLLVQMVSDLDEELEVYRRWEAEGRVDGVVLVDLRDEDPRLPLLTELELPAVLAGGPDPLARVPAVSIDDSAAMRLVLEHLEERGLRSVTYLSGPPELLHVGQRIAAFEAARAEGALDGDVRATDLTAAAAERAIADLLGGAELPSAIICDNEAMAVAVELALRGADVDVPGQVAIVSCEDGPVCEAMRPSLTALHRDTELFGAQVANTLIALLDGQDVPSGSPGAPELRARESTEVQVR